MCRRRLWSGIPMNRRRIGFVAGVVAWGLFVAALTVYLFFPYQKALRIALQNGVGGSRFAVSMEGVSLRTLGMSVSKVQFRVEGNGTSIFELSNVDVAWKPLQLLRGRFGIFSRASAYGGVLRTTIDDIPIAVASTPLLSLRIDDVDVAKFPAGLSWLKGATGRLSGWIRKQTPPGRPEHQTGSFSLQLRDGEIRDLHVEHMPRLVIPFKEIALDGRIEGARLSFNRIAVESDLLTLRGDGTIETGESDTSLNLTLAYRTLSASAPLAGDGVITVSGTETAPRISVSEGMKTDRRPDKS
jgi:type II secretion system protein N